MQEVARLTNALQTLQQKVDQQQEQIDAFTNISAVPSSWPYDEVACRAKSYTDFPRDADAYWMNIGIDTTCESKNTGKTCAHICAQNGLKCDPCAISKLSCQNAIYFAAKEAFMSTIKISTFFGGPDTRPYGSGGLLDYEPGCTPTNCQGPWNQTTCETATEPNKINVVGTKLSYRNIGQHPGLTMQQWVLNSIGGSECLDAGNIW